ncbi:TetR/AcrR family transcriptional regulator [Paenibacillus sp. 1P07SE]|uniref:TetR/AcrR family transcriptional regulator n=1 Tax=Paenibacillus sp. 1P07SE TaxID=3132209 RepID=UPI0039A63DCC
MTDNDKRERIIQAALKVLAERGYDEASTKEIAREAGVAQGLISYYFSGKDLLFAEVFRRESDRYCESMSFLKHQEPRPLTPDTIRAALEKPKSRADENPEYIRLRYELYALGLRNPAVSGSIKDTLLRKRQHLAGLIEAVAGLPEEQARQLSPILMSVLDGLGLQRLSDADFDYDGAYDTLVAMLEAYIGRLGQENR